MIGLLIAFEVVAHDVRRQGEARRRDDALLVEATWRCKALRSGTQCEDCLRRYAQEVPDSSFGVQALVSEVAASARYSVPTASTTCGPSTTKATHPSRSTPRSAG